MSSATVKADVVNSALIALGKEPIADLSDSSTSQSIAAQKVLRVLERARIVTLRRNGWTCCLEYTKLLPATVPNLAFNRRYPTTFLCPADFVRAWEIEGVPCTYDYQAKCWPINAWEPRWQVGTTEVNGSTQWIIRAARGDGDGMFGDGVGFNADDWNGFLPPEGRRVAALDPLVYVRKADWTSYDEDLKDLIAYEAAARAAYAVTADLTLQSKLDGYVAKRLADSVGADAAGGEGGQPPLMPSIPQQLRNFSR